MEEQRSVGSLVFALNGERFEVSSVDPSMTLLEFIRTRTKYRGPKLGCGEGGCGACVVLLAKYEPVSKQVEEFTVSSCLTLLCSIHLCSVTTTEGLGSTKNGFHSIHKRISGFHASQCGFCTPGMCMSIFAALTDADKTGRPEAPAGFSKLTVSEAEKAIAGNLCRCTGYRPIVDTCKSFSADVDMEDLGLNIFWRSGEKNAGVDKLPFYSQNSVNIFPDFLKREIDALSYKGGHISLNSTWIRPKSIDELQALLKTENQGGQRQVRLVVGNTSSGYYKELNMYNKYVDLRGIPELLEIRRNSKFIEIGAAVTISHAIEVLKREVKDKHLSNGKNIFSGIAHHMEKLGSQFIRNTASIGGNLILAQRNNFPSDISTILLAADASVVIQKVSEASVLMLDEFLEMGRCDSEQILLSVRIPIWDYNHDVDGSAQERPTGTVLLFETYRAAPRPLGNALAYVNAAFLAKVFTQKVSGDIVIEDLRLVFGAYGTNHAIRARKVEEFLVGKSITTVIILEAIGLLKTTIVPKEGTHDPAYRSSLAVGFLFEFLSSLPKVSTRPSKVVAKTDLHNGYTDALLDMNFHDKSSDHYNNCVPVLSANQSVKFSDDYLPVGEPIKKAGAEIQASGEAVYVDDIPSPSDCLHGAFICSTRAMARVKGVKLNSTSGKEATIISVKDIPNGGKNVGAGWIFGEEPLFADPITQFAGEPIGLAIADTQKLANMAAAQALVDYDNKVKEPPILSVEEAVQHSSFFEMPPLWTPKQVGDFSKGMDAADHKILSTEIKLGSQYYFYMETQTALAIPDEDNSLVVYSSTQFPMFVQQIVAKCLGIPSHNIRIITRRVGGGFGGKAMKSASVATACALAAYKLQRPVRMYLDRKTDMLLVGGRHPMKITYSIGFKSNGKVTALHIDLLINAGAYADASPIIPHNFIGSLKKYDWGALSFDVKICKTNLSSKSAMRAPGEVQGSYVAEAIIEHVASTLLMDTDSVRKINLHSYESLLRFFEGSAGESNEYTLPFVFDKLGSSSNFHDQVERIKQFNSCNRWKKRGISRVPIIYPVRLGSTPGRVGILNDGSIVVEVGGIELGQGLWTKVQQMTAFALGQLGRDISQNFLHRIRVIQADTLSLIQGGVTAGSTTSESSCEAVRLACNILVDRLMPVKEMLQEQTSLVSWEALISQANMMSVNLSASTYFVPDNTCASYLNYGAAITEVEVDLLTGATAILRTDLTYDCGQSLNPAVDLGQIEGAFVQGIGFFMLEEYLTNADGLVVSEGTWTYKVPTIDTIPKQFNVEILNSGHHKKQVLSSKASGEPPLLLAASVHCATREAIRAARRDLFACGGGEGSSMTFDLPVPATMPVVKELCGLDNVERYLEAMASTGNQSMRPLVPLVGSVA